MVFARPASPAEPSLHPMKSSASTFRWDKGSRPRIWIVTSGPFSRLNQIKPQQGGPATPLKVDGKCGPKTNQAIQSFQLKQFDWPGTDGLIEPGKQTIARINQILFSNQPVDPNEHANIKVKMVSHMGLVSRSIHAAQATLMMALSPPGGLDLGRTPANDKIDRHFATGNLQQGAREQTIRNILGVFNMFANVLLMPGALGAGAFEMDPTGDPRIAFTSATASS